LKGKADPTSEVWSRGRILPIRAPFATTVWDYINRAMPYQNAGSLRAGEVYATTAYVLFLNGIVKETAVLDRKSLPRIRMPNRDGFVEDSRPDVAPQ
jgi:cytochrome c